MLERDSPETRDEAESGNAEAVAPDRPDRPPSSGELLGAIAKATEEALWAKDLQGRYVFANAAASRAIGKSEAEILGRRDDDLFPPEEARCLREEDERVLATGKAEAREAFTSSGPVRRRLLLRKEPYRDAGGRLRGVIGICRDITDEKRVREALSEAEADLRGVMGAISDYLWSAEIGAGGEFRYRYLSPVIERVTGRPAEFYVAGPERWLSTVHAEDRPRLERAQGRLTGGRSTHEELEYRILLPNGTIRWVRDSVMVKRLEAGRLRLDGVVTDISERKRGEEALERSEEHFRSLIENALDVITVLGHDGTVKYASPSVERVLGHRPEDLAGRSVFELVHPDDLGNVRAMLQIAVKTLGPLDSLEIRFLQKNGTWRNLEVVGKYVVDGSQFGSLVLNARDLTDRKELEQQLRQSQKMEAVGRLAGGVAHDFNNILTAILGYSELLAVRLAADPEALEEVEEIRKGGERATALTRQLLAFSRKQMLEPTVLDLNELVENLENMLRRLIGEDIRLATSLDPHLHAVRADAGQMEQVVLNLTVNARDAMPHGGALVLETANVELDGSYTREHRGSSSGDHVMICVRDTGVGMDEDTKLHVFEPFFTTKEKGKGTGLGMATVYGIVKQSGGYISIESTPGEGTTVRVYLPRVNAAARPPAPAPEAGRPPAALRRDRETVLLAEDETAVRALARRLLEGKGFTVLEATDGQEALEVARRHEGGIALLLTDVVMPELDGLELASRLKFLRPGIKVVFMSGYTEDGALSHGLLKDGSGFLRKPFTPEALLRKIDETLDG